VGEIATLGLAGNDAFYQALDATRSNLRTHYGEMANGNPFSFWGELYAGRDRYGKRRQSETVFGTNINYGGRVENHRYGGQGGVDYLLDGVRIGVFAGYGRNKADVGFSSDSRLRGYDVGAYALLGGKTGPYGSVTVQRNQYRVRFENQVRDFTINPDGHTTGIEGEAGLRGDFGAVRYDVNAGLSWARSSLDGFTIDGSAFKAASTNSFRGRLGARATLPGLYGAYLDASLLHEFDGKAKINILNGAQGDTIDAASAGTSARVEAGIGDLGGLPGIVSVYGSVGDVKGFGVRAGVRL